jgi:hypothetical protein
MSSAHGAQAPAALARAGCGWMVLQCGGAAEDTAVPCRRRQPPPQPQAQWHAGEGREGRRCAEGPGPQAVLAARPGMRMMSHAYDICVGAGRRAGGGGAP